MTDRSAPRLAKWPFLLGDLLLVALAGAVIAFSPRPIEFWPAMACLLAVATGATLAVVPFLVEYRAFRRLSEGELLADAVVKLGDLDRLSVQIKAATARWQDVQELSDKTVGSARELTERMTTEARAFTEFLQKANDMEKNHLRLEADKLRRAEKEWLQVTVRILDHVFALHAAAARSRQAGLATQLTQFQNACRDIARRMGLVPFAAGPDQPFDPKQHQLLDPQATPPADALVAETIAAGYHFQGQLLRPALVRLVGESLPGAPAEPAPAMAAGGTPAQKTLL